MGGSGRSRGSGRVDDVTLDRDNFFLHLLFLILLSVVAVESGGTRLLIVIRQSILPPQPLSAFSLARHHSIHRLILLHSISRSLSCCRSGRRSTAVRLQPVVLQALRSRRTLVLVELEHRGEEGSELQRLLEVPLVLLQQDFHHRPWLQLVDVQQLAYLVEEVPPVGALLVDSGRDRPEQLDDVRQMIVVPRVVRTLVWLEEVVARGQLEGHARSAPNVGRRPVASADEHLQGSVLPRLDVLREVVVRPAGVAQISNLDLKLISRRRLLRGRQQQRRHGHRRTRIGEGRETRVMLALCTLHWYSGRGTRGRRILIVDVDVTSLNVLHHLRIVLEDVGDDVRVDGESLHLGELRLQQLALLLSLPLHLLLLVLIHRLRHLLLHVAGRGAHCAAAHLHVQLRRHHSVLSHLFDLVVRHRHQHILRLDVRVDDLALGMHVVQALQHLSNDAAHFLDLEPGVVRSNDQLEQIAAEHLEHHAHVVAVDSRDGEGVEQLDDLVPVRVGRVAVADPEQQLNLVHGRLRVVLGRLDNLESDEASLVRVPAQPHGGEVAPAQLADHVSLSVEYVSDADWMVPAPLVVLGVLLLLIIRPQHLLVTLNVLVLIAILAASPAAMAAGRGRVVRREGGRHRCGNLSSVLLLLHTRPVDQLRLRRRPRLLCLAVVIGGLVVLLLARGAVVRLRLLHLTASILLDGVAIARQAVLGFVVADTSVRDDVVAVAGRGRRLRCCAALRSALLLVVLPLLLLLHSQHLLLLVRRHLGYNRIGLSSRYE
ncbi:hypothetical protein PMAYCL1PPCAC_13571 [Pristionchus mayeri]|uniref:Uncharacterized protein n=1 Tax=Pristionchus mayeri TaxID=1317129 RepID=A0AAN4ZQT6_9BILA|nr:hypothetical protein PMAYCL1PPCAC_13571 [Pristionchus mayeri]